MHECVYARGCMCVCTNILHAYNISHTVNLMSALWRRDRSVRLWWVPRPCAIYEEKYDEIQEHLRSISCMDDLLSGKLRDKNNELSS